VALHQRATYRSGVDFDDQPSLFGGQHRLAFDGASLVPLTVTANQVHKLRRVSSAINR
jgi:hypothetical protein